jgi:hypothetical protein
MRVVPPILLFCAPTRPILPSLEHGKAQQRQRAHGGESRVEQRQGEHGHRNQARAQHHEGDPEKTSGGDQQPDRERRLEVDLELHVKERMVIASALSPSVCGS